MLNKIDKGIWFNTETKHYELRFTFKNQKTGKKSRPHPVAKIKLEDGTIKYAENKDEAKFAIIQYIANGGPIEEVILNKNTALYSDCINEYEKYCNTVGKRRVGLIVNYCNYFLAFLAEYYYSGNIKKAKQQITVSEIQTIDFIRYMSKRQKDKVCYNTNQGIKWTGRYVSNASINREMNSIKGLFNYLKKILKVIGENPCEPLGDPLPVNKKTKEPLTIEQEKIIFDEAEQDTKFYIMLWLFNVLGPRKNEVFSLLWDNLHLEQSQVFPNGYIDFIYRKNGQNLRLPLSRELHELLLLLPRESEYVFTNPDTGTKYNNRYKKLNNIFKKAGVKKRGTGYHIFRHNTSNNLELNGAEASTIKDVLGNTVGVVMSTYLNQGTKRKQEVIDINSERIRKIVTRQEITKNVQETSKNEKVPIRLKIVKH